MDAGMERDRDVVVGCMSVDDGRIGMDREGQMGRRNEARYGGKSIRWSTHYPTYL